jgi:hypothetical protein
MKSAESSPSDIVSDPPASLIRRIAPMVKPSVRSFPPRLTTVVGVPSGNMGYAGMGEVIVTPPLTLTEASKVYASFGPPAVG